MKLLEAKAEPVTFTPDLRAADAVANYWIRQAMIRLRREVAWRWHERDLGAHGQSQVLPAMADRLAASLDMTRYQDARHAFFQQDVTGRYLTDKLAEDRPSSREPPRGSFGWVVAELGLHDVASFALALGLLPCFDGAAAPVMAACVNDPARPHPSLALVQRLWTAPEQVLALGDPAHSLWRLGLIQYGAPSCPAVAAIDWEGPFFVPPLVAAQLLFPETRTPGVWEPIPGEDEDMGLGAAPAVHRLSARRLDMLTVVPVVGPRGAAHASAARAVARAAGRALLRLRPNPLADDSSGHVKSMATLAWMRGVDLLAEDDHDSSPASEHRRPYGFLAGLRTIPVTVFVVVQSHADLAHVPSDQLLPAVETPRLSYAGRLELWMRSLGERAQGLESAIGECARRFRYEKETIRAIVAGLRIRPELTAGDLFQACRAEIPLDTGGLAQRVEPRFSPDELVLPEKQRRQFEEIYRAMRSLTEVHYGWGTARVWNESGISVLFAGPPGTGKTMAAEVLAAQLDLPMYRIDLSQVVNKYVGETEKNLKRVFDMADVSDSILFFDEADALFGRRTEVKDAHDRYANLEVSYLLERMERFKGLAVLATNRRKDLDDAFLRRLRYIVEFPLPEAAQRKAIWERVVPHGVDAGEVDFDFLARQFQLAGGHIRSIVFNTCLQTAEGWSAGAAAARPRLTMERLVVAVKREYDKLGRSVSLEQFGRYAPLVEGIGDD